MTWSFMPWPLRRHIPHRIWHAMATVLTGYASRLSLTWCELARARAMKSTAGRRRALEHAAATSEARKRCSERWNDDRPGGAKRLSGPPSASGRKPTSGGDEAWASR